MFKNRNKKLFICLKEFVPYILPYSEIIPFRGLLHFIIWLNVIIFVSSVNKQHTNINIIISWKQKNQEKHLIVRTFSFLPTFTHAQSMHISILLNICLSLAFLLFALGKLYLSVFASWLKHFMHFYGTAASWFAWNNLIISILLKLLKYC